MRIRQSIECWIFHRRLRTYLLLQCPETKRHPKYWQPITGGVLPKETLGRACLREVREETGIVLQPSELVTVIEEYRIWIPEYRLEVRKPVFTAETDLDEVFISDEHLAYQWVAPYDVKNWLYWDSSKATFEAVHSFYHECYQT
ncbi:NUDIX pyrophosphatase [candidate division KSB3 bacterium]|uniref:NUDIX pyrophosphatase n=1 Tax=candidate division KSB3 bacterium TaxID=2044937 RepID=A0A2G6KCM5_9BACT|nr:MAG: NUDIX pyrophosphatase [candidate division KSB3 bacterium]